MPAIGEFLLQLAAGAVAPVVVALPADAGFAAAKAVNVFGPPIAKRFWEWLRGKPRKEQEAALSQLASITAAQAASLARESVLQHSPNANAQAQELAVRYLSALPGSVRRSLVSIPGGGGMSLPLTLDLQNPESLLPLLPVSAPPFAVPGDLPGSNFYLEEVIGAGGFGTVYRARSKDSTLHFLRFAIKVCLDPEMQVALAALQNELDNLKRLQEAASTDWSERIVKLFGYRLDPAPPFLVYEFVPGGDLASYLLRRQQETGGRVEPDEVRGWVVQIVEGLAFAHAHGLIHRDLKPANVLVTGHSLKLTDFGLGRVVADHARAHSQIRVSVVSQLPPDEQVSLFRGSGTPLYMSPQQREGQRPNPRHDLYSLGVMWHQLLLGDVTKELPHNYRRVLAAKCPGASDQIDLIERCLDCCDDLTEDGLKNAGQLLDLITPPPPPSAIRIESFQPQFVTVAAGSSATVAIQISRHNCNRELKVSVSGLPNMVTSQSALLSGNQTQTQIVLNAASDASPATTNARVSVSGTGVQDAVARLPVSVTAPPPPPPPGPGVTVGQEALRDLLDNAPRFFICNTNRRYSPGLEDVMRQRQYAAVWESFAWPAHMQRVTSGDAIFMWAKGVGIIGVGRAKEKPEILDASAPGRIRSAAEYAEREWRVPVEWLIWVEHDGDAYPCAIPNASFVDASGENYRELREGVRKHFLGDS